VNRLGGKENVRLVEIFSSLQGEGKYLGERQIFVRLGGCNLKCDYCDEPDTIPFTAGRLTPWVAIEKQIHRLAKKKRHKTIAWTGGEPLLHPAFLENAMQWAHAAGFRNYLETNALLAAPFKRLQRYADVVSVDLKLPSSIGRAVWSQHAKFLESLPEDSFIKVVLTEDSTAPEWGRVLTLLERYAPDKPLFLQPATRVRSTRRRKQFVKPITPGRAAAFLKVARERLGRRVRLMPQWHPVWKMR
jgi:7-carboxy-7-deazaguanine synthase